MMICHSVLDALTAELSRLICEGFFHWCDTLVHHLRDTPQRNSPESHPSDIP
jgi:hypothetical protein